MRDNPISKACRKTRPPSRAHGPSASLTNARSLGEIAPPEADRAGEQGTARNREDSIRETFEHWSNGNPAVWTDAIHPEAEVVSLLGNWVYHGYAGIRDWAAEVLDAFDQWDSKIEEMVPAPTDRLLVVGRIHMRGRGSGVDLDVPCAWLFEFLEGRIARMEIFINRIEEGQVAAGLGRATASAGLDRPPACVRS